MTIQAMLESIASDGRSISIIILVMMSLVQIAPIKLNPWTAILSWLGKQLNKDVSDKVDSVEKRLDKVEQNIENMNDRMSKVESHITNLDKQMENLDTRLCSMEDRLNAHITDSEDSHVRGQRARILEFAAVVIRGEGVTREHFDFMIRECDNYEKYCKDHKLMNGVATASINEIRRVYQERLRKNEFISEPSASK